ncbi:MAG: hypothetical protein DYG87_09995 [Anaerolineae bacterium CFX3]|jgi:hypothetical protein|nr:hypothetical protein [Anaerolineae bacterium CFX3]MCQ3947318.1 hypothetical protein [Anaerolineae bacterium]MCZ7549681.1 hypothetical protein [Anaerolineales bacterium]GER80315.1 conserved hypothetical protein [Candidatus Denitrolinea symbiosum]MDX9936495.1 hypothetical protein [Anaerolineales bacterium]
MNQIDTAAIVRGLDPADWVQIKLLRSLPPEKRIIPAMRAQAFAMSTFKLALKSRYPELSDSELNMKVLRHFTTVRMPEE